MNYEALQIVKKMDDLANVIQKQHQALEKHENLDFEVEVLVILRALALAIRDVVRMTSEYH